MRPSSWLLLVLYSPCGERERGREGAGASSATASLLKDATPSWGAPRSPPHHLLTPSPWEVGVQPVNSGGPEPSVRSSRGERGYLGPWGQSPMSLCFVPSSAGEAPSTHHSAPGPPPQRAGEVDAGPDAPHRFGVLELASPCSMVSPGLGPSPPTEDRAWEPVETACPPPAPPASAGPASHPSAPASSQALVVSRPHLLPADRSPVTRTRHLSPPEL